MPARYASTAERGHPLSVCPICIAPFDGPTCPRCGHRGDPPPEGALGPGAKLRGGRYTIDAFLAKGGQGAVYRAHDAHLQRPCALKELLDPDRPSERATRIAAFQREAGTLASLHHPRIVDVWDFFEEGGRYYLVMEFLEGGDLNGLDLPLSEPRALDIAVAIAEALAHLHQRGIVYRDLKPANVMFREDGGVVLADFGIARAFTDPTKHDTHVMGTPGYLPPEQLAGRSRPASDVYSAAATLHQLLTGKPPDSWPLGERDLVAKIPPILEVDPGVTGDLARLMDACLAHDAAARPQDGAALVAALEEVRDRWRHALCSCGRQNAPGTRTCGACRRPLQRPRARSAAAPGPFAWRVRPPFVQAWRTPLGAAVRGSVLLVEGRLEIATESGHLHEVDLDGRLVRSTALGAASRSTVVAHERGRLVGTRRGLATSNGWLYRGAEVFAPPLPGPDGVVLLTYAGELMALDWSGRPQWRQQLRGEGIHPVVPVGDDLLAATKLGVLRRVSRTGDVRWEADLGVTVRAHPVPTADAIVVVDERGRLRLLDPETGGQRAQRTVLDGADASPGYDASGWVLAGRSGAVVRLDRHLDEAWRQDFGAGFVAPPVLAGPWAILADLGGSLRILRSSDGQVEARFDLDATWVSAPVADGNALFAVTRGGDLVCIVGHG